MSNKPGKMWLRGLVRKERVREGSKRKYRCVKKSLEHRKQAGIVGGTNSGNGSFPEGFSRIRTPTSALSEMGRELTNH